MSLGFGFGMPRRVFAAPFTPQSLFSTGAQGAWYDPSDINLNWRYNLLTYTEQFDNAAWGTVLTGSATISRTGNLGIAPNGTNTATKCDFNATGTDIAFINSSVFSASTGQVFTGSFYAKAATGADVGKQIIFRQAGTAAYTVATLTSDWVRYYSTETAQITNPVLAIGLRPSVSGSSGPVSVLLWGAQLQTGSVATTYQQIVTPEISYLTYQPQPVLYQDAAGTTPVTAVEQPVGLMLDKSKGLVLGSELVTNGNFSQGTTGWSAAQGATITAVGGYIEVTNTSINGQAQQTLSGLKVGASYLATGVAYINGGGKATIQPSGYPIWTETGNSTPTPLQMVFVATATTQLLVLQMSSSTAGYRAYFDNISVRELPGNHAFQTTAPSRPVLSARYNLLTKTEQFDDAAWSSSNVQARTAVAAPNGTLTAYAVIQNAASGLHGVSQSINISAASMMLTVIAKTAVGSNSGRFVLRNGADGSYATFDLNSGTVVSSGPGTATITPYGSGWYTCTLAYTGTTVLSSQQIFLGQSTSTGAGGVYSFAGDNVSGVYLWHPSLVQTAQAPTAYQRVNTSTDYDTVGFKPYLLADGVDDGMVTNSIDFTATDKMTVCAGVRKLSDAVLGTVFELSSDSSALNGTFGVLTKNSTFYQYVFGSRGTAPSAALVNGSIYDAPVTNILTGIGGISNDQDILRINGAQVGQSLADQGTGNYGNYPLYLFRRGGASLPFNGRMYEMTIVGKTLTAGELVNLETYTNQKTGAY